MIDVRLEKIGFRTNGSKMSPVAYEINLNARGTTSTLNCFVKMKIKLQGSQAAH